jgi:hypothetical protein
MYAVSAFVNQHRDWRIEAHKIRRQGLGYIRPEQRRAERVYSLDP